MKIIKLTLAVVIFTSLNLCALSVNAGIDKTLMVNNNYVPLMGSVYQLNNNPNLSYTWKEGSTVISTHRHAYYKPTTVGTHTLTFVATNGSGATAQSTVKITATAVPANLLNGLVAHYQFDENMNDSSSLSNAPAVVQGTVSYMYGRIGYASWFNAGQDKITLSSINKFVENKNKFTISYWVLPLSTKVQSYLSKRAVCTFGDAFDMRGKGNRIGFENTNPNPSHKTVKGTLLNLNTWTLVTVIKNGNKITLYENGIKQGSYTTAKISFLAGDLSFSKSPCVGVDGTFRLNGAIDDFRIYNRELSVSEMQQLHTLPLQ